MGQSVSAVLDRTNTSVRNSTMIVASVLNATGRSERIQERKLMANTIRQNNDYTNTKCVVYWDGKLLDDVTGSSCGRVERMAVILTNTLDGSTKLLGIYSMYSVQCC